MTAKVDWCQCEQSDCEHGKWSCTNESLFRVRTIYGYYNMCLDCAASLPHKYWADTADLDTIRARSGGK